MCICCSLMVVPYDKGLDEKRVCEAIELHSSCLHVFNNLQVHPSVVLSPWIRDTCSLTNGLPLVQAQTRLKKTLQTPVSSCPCRRLLVACAF